MFKKLQRNLERKKEGKAPVKFRFDVKVGELKDAPAVVERCRIVWSRGAKLQMTHAADVEEGVVDFGGKLLSQVATVYKGNGNEMEPKEYAFKVQVPGKGNSQDKMLTLGKGVIDLAGHASLEASTSTVSLPITFAANGQDLGCGTLEIEITSHLMRGFAAEDGMTVMSGLSGISSPFDTHFDQDLSGFDIPNRAGANMDKPPLPQKLSTTVSLRSTIEEAENEGQEFDSIKSTVDMDALQARINELEEQAAAQRKENLEKDQQLKEMAAKHQTELAAVGRQVEAERAEKKELENQLQKNIEKGGESDIEAAVEAAVAARDVRYQKLMEEFELVQHNSQEELDDLHQQLLSAQEQVMELANQLQVSERARESLGTEKRALESSLMETSTDRLDLERSKDKLLKELNETRDQLNGSPHKADDDGLRIMQELIDAKVNLAELHEKHTVIRHELYKSRETNMFLAAKLTKMEAFVYMQREAHKSPKSQKGLTNGSEGEALLAGNGSA